MNALIRTVAVLSAALALSACGVFGDDDDKDLEPTELTDIETTVPIKRFRPD